MAKITKNEDPKSIDKLIAKYEEKIKRGFLRLIILRLFYEDMTNEQPNRELNGYHGWALKQKIKNMSNDRWDPSSGSIYPILKEFYKDGLIFQLSEGEGDKIVYKMTDKGMNIYVRLEDISPLIKSHRDDFSRRVPEPFLRKGFSIAQSHRSLEELQIMKERFEIFTEVLDEMIERRNFEE